jgi:hypothetical protein
MSDVLDRDPQISAELKDRLTKELKDGKIMKFFADANANGVSDTAMHELLSKNYPEGPMVRIMRFVMGPYQKKRVG